MNIAVSAGSVLRLRHQTQLDFGQNLHSPLAVFVQSLPGVEPVKGNDRCDIGIIC